MKELGSPVALSTMKNEHECIDYFLTQDNQLLENFLPPSKYQIELRLIFSKNQGPRTNYPPTLGEYELIKVLGTGGFSQVLMGKLLPQVVVFIYE